MVSDRATPALSARYREFLVDDTDYFGPVLLKMATDLKLFDMGIEMLLKVSFVE
jgi:hypothetical protein